MSLTDTLSLIDTMSLSEELSLEETFGLALLSLSSTEKTNTFTRYWGVSGSSLIYVYQLPDCFHLVMKDVGKNDLARLFQNEAIMKQLDALDRSTVIIIYANGFRIPLPKGFYIFERNFGLTSCASIRYGFTDLKIRCDFYDDKNKSITMTFVDFKAMSSDTVVNIGKALLKKQEIVHYFCFKYEKDGVLIPIEDVTKTTLADIYHTNLVLVIGNI
jgi:hypothetical protein